MMLEIAGVSKSYRSARATVHALSEVDISISAGEAVALMGPSGCGKSTLLGIVGLVLRPDAGEVLLDGVPAPTSERKRARLRNDVFGYVPQEYAIIDGDSAERNASIPLEYASPRIRGRARRARTLGALDLVGLAWASRTNVAKLSGGERQRVAIARALVNNPALILADEPSSALDIATASEVMTLLLAARERGASLLVATHDPRVAERCDRVLRMSDGHLV